MIINITERWPSIYVVSLEGPVDQSTSPEARKAMASLFKNEDLDQILVDLSKVSYIESSGIATLVEALQKSKRRGIRFTLAGINPSVEAVFELANLRNIFEIVPRVEAALPSQE